ncbi:hypothetical protein, partial [Rhizobium johnstonii]|uniref:hypothetical protein n=1 Tax=Rhizobium johnstonii TaxID=3019933 RepID=UPI003F9E3241
AAFAFSAFSFEMPISALPRLMAAASAAGGDKAPGFAEADDKMKTAADAATAKQMAIAAKAPERPASDQAKLSYDTG